MATRQDRRIQNALRSLDVAVRMVKEARTTIRREIVKPVTRQAASRYPEADVQAARRLMRLED